MKRLATICILAVCVVVCFAQKPDVTKPVVIADTVEQLQVVLDSIEYKGYTVCFNKINKFTGDREMLVNLIMIYAIDNPKFAEFLQGFGISTLMMANGKPIDIATLIKNQAKPEKKKHYDAPVYAFIGFFVTVLVLYWCLWNLYKRVEKIEQTTAMVSQLEVDRQQKENN